MHNLGAIVGGAYRGLLEDVADQYRHMESMSQQGRDNYLKSLKLHATETQSKLEGSEVQKGKLALLKFQYASRIIYAVDENNKRHFDDHYKWEKWDEGEEILSWCWTPPSESDFLRVMVSWLTKVDFYTQVNEICDVTFALPLPGLAEPFDQYTKRASIDEATWRWRYDNAAEQERNRWFTSNRKLAEIEQQRNEHKTKAENCVIYLLTFYPEIRPSSDMLQELKRLELGLSSHVLAVERAHEALRQGVQLKHLLLEESQGLSHKYSEVARGL